MASVAGRALLKVIVVVFLRFMFLPVEYIFLIWWTRGMRSGTKKEAGSTTRTESGSRDRKGRERAPRSRRWGSSREWLWLICQH
jgi:hypothetical protein